MSGRGLPEGLPVAAGTRPGGVAPVAGAGALVLRPAVARPAGRPVGAPGLRGPLALAAVAVLGTALVALRDPHVPGSYGICPFHAVTHLWCPACGGLRATYDLVHLHLAAAWSENALWVALVPVLVVGWVVLVGRRASGRAPRSGRSAPAWLAWTGLAVVVAFGVLRNLPALAFLAP